MVSSINKEPNSNTTDLDSGSERSGVFSVAHSNAAPLFENVETPAAVMMADELAEEMDFFSLETNDLTQYTLAIDRQNPKLDNFYDPYHPAVLRMSRHTVEAGHRHGCRVGICGELGADSTLTETFLRMSLDELSVSPSSVLSLRKLIRGMDLSKPAEKV